MSHIYLNIELYISGIKINKKVIQKDLFKKKCATHPIQTIKNSRLW